jgi:hypothetical protein
VIVLPSLFTKRRDTASCCSVNQAGHKFEAISSNKPTTVSPSINMFTHKSFINPTTCDRRQLILSFCIQHAIDFRSRRRGYSRRFSSNHIDQSCEWHLLCKLAGNGNGEKFEEMPAYIRSFLISCATEEKSVPQKQSV